MVDKEIRKKPRRSNVDQHDNAAGPRYESLELRLLAFIEKLNAMNAEVEEIKNQQRLLLDLLKKTIK